MSHGSLDTARARLAGAAEAVAVELVRLALEAESEAVRLRAIGELFDRIGLSEPKQVEVITIEAIDREIARLEAELGVSADETLS